MNEYLPLIEEHLHHLFKIENCPEKKVYEAAHYALFSGGKRIRPLLTMAATIALNGNVNSALTPACALEMIHTYSMIHDDLPCMDNDDFRRGKPTVHKKFDEATALLAGDLLLTYAFEILAKCELTPDIKVRLISCLAKQAGGHGMIGGQTLDLDAEKEAVGLEALKNIHAKKTGALISAALEFSGIIAHADTKYMELLRAFGHNIGIAFQIMDDVIDVTASVQKHGKSSDQINGKTTYISFMEIEEAKEHARKYLIQAHHFANFLPKPGYLTLMANTLVERNL